MLKRTLLARLAHAPRIPSVSARFHSSDKSPLFSPTFSSPIKPSHSPSSSSSSSSPPAPTSYSDLLAPSPSPTDIPAAPPPPPKLRPSIPFTPWDPDAFHNVGKDEAKRQALERHDAAIRLFTEQDVMPGEIAKIMNVKTGTVRTWFLQRARKDNTVFHQMRLNWHRVAFEPGTFSLEECPTIEDAYHAMDSMDAAKRSSWR